LRWSRKTDRPEGDFQPEEEKSSTPPPDPGRASPGLEALISGLGKGRGHTILDLGPSVEGNFTHYSRYARRIRFADFLTNPPRGAAFTAALHALDPPPGGAFDLVLVWNLMDLLVPDERAGLISRLHEITDRGARIYMVVDSSGAEVTQPFRFTVLDSSHLRQEPMGRLQPIRYPLLPAEVIRVLSPFEVLHAFTLRNGLREYVGEKGGGGLR
jgi:hypothetical protein